MAISKIRRGYSSFLRFANFYQMFIKRLSKIITLLTLILWTTARSTRSIFRRTDKAQNNKVNSGQAVCKSGKRVRPTIIKDSTNFLSLKVQVVFICLQNKFTKASILHYFDPKCPIWIEIDVIEFAINGMLSHLFLNINHVIHKNGQDH